MKKTLLSFFLFMLFCLLPALGDNNPHLRYSLTFPPEEGNDGTYISRLIPTDKGQLIALLLSWKQRELDSATDVTAWDVLSLDDQGMIRWRWKMSWEKFNLEDLTIGEDGSLWVLGSAKKNHQDLTLWRINPETGKEESSFSLVMNHGDIRILSLPDQAFLLATATEAGLFFRKFDLTGKTLAEQSDGGASGLEDLRLLKNGRVLVIPSLADQTTDQPVGSSHIFCLDAKELSSVWQASFDPASHSQNFITISSPEAENIFFLFYPDDRMDLFQLVSLSLAGEKKQDIAFSSYKDGAVLHPLFSFPIHYQEVTGAGHAISYDLFAEMEKETGLGINREDIFGPDEEEEGMEQNEMMVAIDPKSQRIFIAAEEEKTDLSLSARLQAFSWEK